MYLCTRGTNEDVFFEVPRLSATIPSRHSFTILSLGLLLAPDWSQPTNQYSQDENPATDENKHEGRRSMSLEIN